LQTPFVSVTIRDVARAAGVSAATVSRALTGRELVRPETRERVQRVAGELGYQHNRAARALSAGRTGTIGLIVPDLANPYFPSVIKGMQGRAREADLAVIVADTDEDAQAELTLVRAMSHQVDGIVLASPRMGDNDLRIVSEQVPVVLLNARVGRIGSVTVDNVDGVWQAAVHLVALGHRRIGYVAGPVTSWANRERLRGLRAATAASMVELVEFDGVLPRFEGGVASTEQALASGVTAVVAYNDLVALGLLSGLAARGIDVPGRLSVVGIDDIVAASMVHPALTTVALPGQLTGRAGVELLLQLISEPGSTARRELPTKLVVRGSTGPPLEME
jgi:DNA-binding LacI/PurR family transcriptional regulator